MTPEEIAQLEALNKRRTPALRLGMAVAILLVFILPPKFVLLAFPAWLIVYLGYMYLTRPVTPDKVS